MNISYKRTANTSYMIIEGGGVISGYEEQMLKNNDITALLPFYSTCTDGTHSYWYDISGKISLADYFKRSGINSRTLLLAFRGLAVALREISKYLIPQEHILLTVDTVYIKESGIEPLVYLCFFPDGSTLPGMAALTEHLINVVDHNDQANMGLCYELYDISVLPESGIYSLIDHIENMTFETGQKIEPRVEISDRCIQMHADEHEDPIDDKSTDIEEYDNKKHDNMKHKNQKNNPGGRIKSAFDEIIDRIKERFGLITKRKKDLFPMGDMTDLVYEPDASLYEPTVLMGKGEMRCEGRLVYDGNGDGEDITVDKTDYQIGSMVGENDAVIASSAVSRHHAMITTKNGEFYLQDMNSTNGTYLNEKLLAYHEPVKLSYYDRVRFADRAYRFM